MQTSLSALREKAAKLNEEINADFSKVRNALSADSMDSYETEEELQEHLDNQKMALQSLMEKRISKMSAEDRERYNKGVASRMAEIDKIMADDSLTLAEKKEQMAKINREMAAVVADLNEEALVTEEELEDGARCTR